jgi:predicted nucleic acid-binding Zn ribbon protein
MILTRNLPPARAQGTTTPARTRPVPRRTRRRDRVVLVRRPTVELRERLAAARRAGASFDEAWPSALKAAVNASQWERAEWLEALSGTAEAWRAGWERQPATRPERAFAMLVMPGGEPLPERACEQCGGEIPPERDRRARFCSDGCAKRAAYLRERERAAAPSGSGRGSSADASNRTAPLEKLTAAAGGDV